MFITTFISNITMLILYQVFICWGELCKDGDGGDGVDMVMVVMVLTW